MSLNELISKTRNNLLDTLWKQWTLLGVAGSVSYSDNIIIDPEALLLFTMEFGRYDPRLYDEVIDWCFLNEKWISLQRLKNLTEDWNRDISTRAIRSLAGILKTSEKKHRWQSIIQMKTPASDKTTDFFLNTDNRPLMVSENKDAYFAESGLLRHPVKTRRLSIAIPMELKSTLIFKLRSLFGLGPRAEIIAYLWTHSNVNTSEIAHATGYTRPPVSEAVIDLVEGNYVIVNQVRSRKQFSITTQQWMNFTGINEPFPVWVDWSSVFKAIICLLDFFSEIENMNLSEYILRSRMVTVYGLIRDELSQTSFYHIFAKPINIDIVTEEFKTRVGMLLNEIGMQD